MLEVISLFSLHTSHFSLRASQSFFGAYLYYDAGENGDEFIAFISVGLEPGGIEQIGCRDQTTPVVRFRGLPCRQCCICSQSPPHSERPVLPQHLPRWRFPSVGAGSQACVAPPANSPTADTTPRSVSQTQKSDPASHFSRSASSTLLFKLPSSNFKLHTSNFLTIKPSHRRHELLRPFHLRHVAGVFNGYELRVAKPLPEGLKLIH